MPVACFSEEGPLTRSSLNGGRRRVSAWANPILSVRYGAKINGFSPDFSLKALFNVV